MSELVGSVCLGLADLVTDAITYARLGQSGYVAVPNEGYKTAYVVILCFGVVTTALSLLYRLRNALLVRAHVRELGEQGRTIASASAARRQAQQNEWELAQTHRTLAILSLALLSVAAQGMGQSELPLCACARRGRISDVPFVGLPMSIANIYLICISNVVVDQMV